MCIITQASVFPNAQPDDDVEYCIMACGNPTGYKKSDPVEKRLGYVDGAGQLCKDCLLELDPPKQMHFPGIFE